MSSVAECADQIGLSPAQLLVAIAEHEQQAAVLALAVNHVEARGDWALDGSVSMRAWLRHNGRMSNRDASIVLRRGRFLNRFATIADAAVARTLSAGQIGELELLHQPKLEALLDEHQQLLVAQLAALDVASTKTVCALWRQRAEAVIDDTEPAQDPQRSLTMTRAGDGALLGRFTLDDAAATELEKAIRNASSNDAAGERSVCNATPARHPKDSVDPATPSRANCSARSPPAMAAAGSPAATATYATATPTTSATGAATATPNSKILCCCARATTTSSTNSTCTSNCYPTATYTSPGPTVANGPVNPAAPHQDDHPNSHPRRVTDHRLSPRPSVNSQLDRDGHNCLCSARLDTGCHLYDVL